MLLAVLGLFATSCSDPCKKTVCYNGYCANGDCVCETGYTGADCSVEVTPTRIKVSRIDVSGFPATDANGAGWDLNSGCDIYPIFGNNTTTTVLYDGRNSFEQNATPGTTYSWEFNTPINIDNPTDQHVISLYDFDDFDADDFMGGFTFTPYTKGEMFPSKLTIKNSTISNLEFVLYVTYEF